MDYLKLLYRILRLANNALEIEEIPPASEIYTPDLLNASETAIEAMIIEAYQNGYIKGVHVVEVDGMSKPRVLFHDSHITTTIKGIEYLCENSTMKKIAKIAKGMKDIIPGA